ncbi:uncharacterized protein LOC111028063 [Myzus persicae]|uniref:uncharacterized protein LOC111028063 n=1 Tax=Myzus persicae TaxID=13164 RepID=UPI000B9314C2|nr:uncharacterized protein LOC111028063 [Myzus persicae]
MITHLSQSTGISCQTISKTIAEYNKTKTVSYLNKRSSRTSLFCNIDDLDHNELRKKVHSIWLRRELPTFDKILVEVNQDLSLPNFKSSGMYNIIEKLDFIFTKIKKCSVLTEREDLIAWRRNYLYDIRKYREEGRSIYYLDEVWLNFSDCVDRTSINKTVHSKHDAFDKGFAFGLGKRLIMIHIGSDKGFLPEGLFICFESKKQNVDYRNEMNGDNFKEWFEYILPQLDPNSIIVMDNAPYHSVKAELYPTASSKKSEILKWLNLKGVTFDRPMLKAQLLIRVHELKPHNNNLYIIDNMAKDAGHTVLRLPPYHCELNPIELAWTMVKGYMKQENTATFEIDDVRLLLNRGIERVTPENWKNFIKQVIEEENKLWEVDNIMDKLIDEMKPCTYAHNDGRNFL